MYKHLDSQQIILTIEKFSRRICEHFPNSGLGAVSHELVALLFFLFSLVIQINVTHQFFELSQFLQSFDAFLESLVYLGATGIFFLNIETGLKWRRALEAFHEMRALAHVVDIDPSPSESHVFGGGIQKTSERK